jgi:uncharacterized membrane protein
MRNITIRLHPGKGKEISDIAMEHDALDASYWTAHNSDEPVDIVSIQIRNESVQEFLKIVQGYDPISITLDPHEVLHFDPPISQASKSLLNLEHRSPIEIFLMGLQSISSWRNFAIYAAAGAFIVWVAFFSNSIYLLIAAMLVSPFAGPAMNVAMATATGDTHLLKENVSRYFAAIGFTVLVTGLLTYLFNQNFITDLMLNVGHLSRVSALLPIVAGVAGSFTLIQSERSSLISGSTVGMLVTTSLAPPAGLLGIALVMQNWDLLTNTVFILMLQLVAINLSGSIVYRLFGLNTSISQFKRGKRWIFIGALVFTLISLAGLLVWQFSGSLSLQRISEETRVTQDVLDVVQNSELVVPIEVEVDFYSTEAYGENTLLVNVYAQKVDNDISPETTRILLAEDIIDAIKAENTKIIPFVNITFLESAQDADSISIVLSKKGQARYDFK